MTPLDLLASPLGPILPLVTLGYVLAVVQWPFGTCRRCRGTGKARSWFSGRTYRICRRCGGTGRRLRPARRVWNHLSARHRTARLSDGRTARQANRDAARATERNAR